MVKEYAWIAVMTFSVNFLDMKNILHRLAFYAIIISSVTWSFS